MTTRPGTDTRASLRRFTATTPAAAARDLTQRLFTAGLAAAELAAMQLGVRLGFYAALAAAPATAGELAERSGTAPRYTREWLEQQAAAGIVEVDDPEAAAADRCYRLPEGHRQVLAGADSSMVALAVLPVAGVAPLLPRLADAYRAGTGVPFEAYGDVFRQMQDGMNRSVFDQLLARWVRVALPDVDARLGRSGAAIADLGCGSGWSTLALARAYPAATVRGVDLDRHAVERARVAATGRAEAGRVSFVAADIAELPAADRFDLICVLDALHDMPRPVDVLRACRQRLVPGGCVLLMEPRAEPRFTAPAGEVERFLYAVSVLHCLPVGLADQPSAGTGAVLRPETVRRYATAAGFASATVLPVEHRFHRLYRLG